MEETGRPLKALSRETRFIRLKHFLNQNVLPDALLETELMILALASGINDATTFPDYHVFASNQTGNTALLAVGALGIAKETVDLKDVAFSLGMFLVGGFAFGQPSQYFGTMRRSWLLCTSFLQTCLVLVAAALRTWVPTSTHDPARFAVISLLALASGGQVAMARTVKIPEITTAMVTSAYIDFLVDPELLFKHNRSRNRRLLFVLALLVGSFIGAVAYKEVGPALALLLVALSKLAVCVAILFNHGETPQENRKDCQEVMLRTEARQ